MATGGEKEPTFGTTRTQRVHSGRCAPLDNREGSSLVEDGARGVVEGHFIGMKYQNI